MSLDSKTYGLKIRNLRKKRHMTQEALAETVGISTNYMGMIERGEKIPSLSLWDNILRAISDDSEEEDMRHQKEDLQKSIFHMFDILSSLTDEEKREVTNGLKALVEYLDLS